MREAVREPSERQIQLSGYSMPLKDLLGVGASIEDSQPETYIFLTLKAWELNKNIFGKPSPEPAEMEAAIKAGTILDFRDPRSPVKSMASDFGWYMKQLAYHHFLKRAVMRIACAHQVIVAGNPLSEKINHPLESLIVPKDRGRRSVEEFISHVAAHMLGKYGLTLRKPEEIGNDSARGLAWAEVEAPCSLISHPHDFGLSIREQMPPQSDDVKAVRAYFNRWYVQQPHVQARIVDAMLKGAASSKTVYGGLDVTITLTPEQRVANLLQDRI